MPRSRTWSWSWLRQAICWAKQRLRPQVHHRLQQGVQQCPSQDPQNCLSSQVHQRSQDPLRWHHSQGRGDSVHQRSKAKLPPGRKAGKWPLKRPIERTSISISDGFSYMFRCKISQLNESRSNIRIFNVKTHRGSVQQLGKSFIGFFSTGFCSNAKRWIQVPVTTHVEKCESVPQESCHQVPKTVPKQVCSGGYGH